MRCWGIAWLRSLDEALVGKTSEVGFLVPSQPIPVQRLFLFDFLLTALDVNALVVFELDEFTFDVIGLLVLNLYLFDGGDTCRRSRFGLGTYEEEEVVEHTMHFLVGIFQSVVI